MKRFLGKGIVTFFVCKNKLKEDLVNFLKSRLSWSSLFVLRRQEREKEFINQDYFCAERK